MMLQLLFSEGKNILLCSAREYGCRLHIIYLSPGEAKEGFAKLIQRVEIPPKERYSLYLGQLSNKDTLSSNEQFLHET